MEFTKNILKNSGVQIAILIGGLAITIVNLYISSLISPISQNLGQLVNRVEAIEETLSERGELVERFIVVEQNTKNIESNIQDIKDALKRIEDRVNDL